jgi:hypothetical protein
MKFLTHYLGVLILTLLTGANSLAQHEAKGEANLKSLANRETKTGSGPESPGAGLQGTRSELYKIQQSDTEDNTVNSAFGSGTLIKDAGDHPGNWAAHNRLTGNGVGQRLPASVLHGTSSARIEGMRFHPFRGPPRRDNAHTLVPKPEKCSDVE